MPICFAYGKMLFLQQPLVKGEMMDFEKNQFLTLCLTRHILQHCPNVIFANSGTMPEDRLHQFMLNLSNNIDSKSPFTQLKRGHIESAFDLPEID